MNDQMAVFYKTAEGLDIKFTNIFISHFKSNCKPDVKKVTFLISILKISLFISNFIKTKEIMKTNK